MQVTKVPDPRIEEPTGVFVKVTSTGPCGSGLHPSLLAGEAPRHHPDVRRGCEP